MSSPNATQYLQHLLQLIHLERTEEINQYTQLVKNTSIDQRRKNGATWYPIIITNEEIDIGNQIVIDVQPSTPPPVPHNFQVGQTIAIFSNAENLKRPTLQAVVARTQAAELRLSINLSEEDDLPDWLYEGKIGIDLMYNETTFKEMENALNQLIRLNDAENKTQNRHYQLREIIAASQPAYFETPTPLTLKHLHKTNLNESQNLALQRIDQANDLALIHGPPGTGKTTTLVQAILQTLQRQKQVLVTAPSNTAVDLLTQKLADQNLQVLRIGHPARIDESLVSQTIDFKMTQHPEYKKMKQLHRHAHQLRNQAHKYKRNFTPELREQRKQLLAEARDSLDYARSLEKYIIKELIENAQVITATLVGTNSNFLKNKIFDTVFIDEAAQALAPATFIPILKAKRVIMAGDHCQLPPTVKSAQAQRQGLNISLFEKIIQTQPHCTTMLTTQYRMNEIIMQFSSSEFYQNQLVAHPTIKHHVLWQNPQQPNYPLSTPFTFIDTAGCGFDEQQNPNTLSYTNPKEADLLLQYLNNLIETLENKALDSTLTTSIGIVSPYKQQVEYLANELKNYPFLQTYAPFIAVKTIDGFQGQERDIMAVSMVRSNDKNEIGFLSDTRRTNVALTRARKKLIVIADSATLSAAPFYNRFLQYIEKQEHTYKSAWELMY